MATDYPPSHIDPDLPRSQAIKCHVPSLFVWYLFWVLLIDVITLTKFLHHFSSLKVTKLQPFQTLESNPAVSELKPSFNFVIPIK